MTAAENILTRRSIRKYKNQKADEGKINNILKAGMYAPSAFNLQPWEFLVIDDKQIFEKIIKAVPYAEMLTGASHAIVICGNNEKEKNPEFLIQDCSAAIQNILLQSNSEGLGACWIALCGMQESVTAIMKLFELPANIIPIAMVSIGYPDEQPDVEERFIKSKIHINKW